MRMLRALVAGVAGAAAAVAVMSAGGLPGTAAPVAATCQRSVAIDPQVSVSEASQALTFTVRTGSCAAAGEVSFVVVEATARRGLDFVLYDGRLKWAAGDTSARQITATVIGDQVTEALIEEFRVVLVGPSPDVRLAASVLQARILDDDRRDKAAVVDDRICLLKGENPGQDFGQGFAPASATPSPGSPSPTPPTMQTCTIEPGHIIPIFVHQNGGNPEDQTFTFATSDGGLKANLDYVPVNATVVIPAGQTVVRITVRLLPHAYTQPGKSFNVRISAFSGGVIADGQATFTVLG